jgi:hypothetical protein
LTEQPPLWKRLAWFAGLWAASVTALAIVAYLIRFWIA